MSLYEELGVAKDADKPTIKRAYRKKAQKVHPDKGGKAQEFVRLQLAYTILSDDKRREKYDATGDESETNECNEIMSSIAGLILALINEARDVDTQNLIDMAISRVANNKLNLAQQNLSIKKVIAKKENALRRLKVKDGSENILGAMILASLNEDKSKLDKLEELAAWDTKVIKFLENYEYLVETEQWQRFV